jgi:seryl-tRNA synthetase
MKGFRTSCSFSFPELSCRKDRLHEAGTKLTERVEALKALEADRRLQAEHERVSAERDRLADELNRMVKPNLQIAHLVVEIEAVDRVIGRLNATSALQHGHIAPVLIGSPRALQVLFADALVWDGFLAVARLPSKEA